MATLKANKLSKKVYSGEVGDASVFVTSYVAAAAQIADKIQWAQLPAGIEIVDISLVNDAMGASSTLNIGFEYVDSANGAAEPTAFKAATDVSTAGKQTTAFHPRYFADDVILTSVVAGGAITGKVSLIITYRFVGTL